MVKVVVEINYNVKEGQLEINRHQEYSDESLEVEIAVADRIFDRVDGLVDLIKSKSQESD